MTSRVLRNSHNTTLFLGLRDNYKNYSHQNISYGRKRTWGRRQCFQFVCITCLSLARRWWTSGRRSAERLDLTLARKSDYSAPNPLAVNPRKKQEPDQIGQKWQRNSNPQIWLYILGSLNDKNWPTISQNAKLEMLRHFEVCQWTLVNVV